MTTVIMQPTYLPWVGYFDLIDQAEKFVFLDNVQFEKQSWQQRNRIRTANDLDWLTVPVFIKGKFGQKINEVEINTAQFPEKQIKTLRQNYNQCKFFKDYWPSLEAILWEGTTNKSLSKLNMNLILQISKLLGLSTRFLLGSDFETDEKRSARLVHIIRETGSDQYLSPLGSLEYLTKDQDIFKSAGITIVFQSFSAPRYQQKHEPYLPGTSIIDMLFNIGAEATVQLMRRARGKPLSLAKVAQERSRFEL